jgi:hypothetical protein
MEINIPLRSTEDIRIRAHCGKTKHEKYGAYLDVLREHPEIINYLLDSIDQSKGGEILVRAVDMAKALGSDFEELSETTIYWSMRFALFYYGIWLSTKSDKEINSKTGKNYMLLRMRIAKPDDKLSADQAQYYEAEYKTEVEEELKVCRTRVE